MSDSPIPLVDLKAAHRAIADEVMAGFRSVMESTRFVLGEEVAAFEREFAAMVGVEHCVGVASGTDAIELALRALGVGTGDEVLVPAATFIATATAVVRAGARPVLVDVDPEYLLMDGEQLAERITPQTRAIVPVHLYGQMAPMREVLEFARTANVPVMEDASQAHGARQEGRAAGSLGAAAAFSFYPGKNLGAYGDAGAVVTQGVGVAESVAALRNYGSRRRYEHPLVGFNSRLDSLQAVVLRAKLKRLAAGNEARREAAARYDQLLAEMPEVRRPQTRPGNEHVWHLYVVRVPHRDRVMRQLNERGIGAGAHYPRPLHLHGALAYLGYRRGDFPTAEAAAAEVLSLPLFPEITPQQQERVVEVVKEILKSL